MEEILNCTEGALKEGSLTCQFSRTSILVNQFWLTNFLKFLTKVNFYIKTWIAICLHYTTLYKRKFKTFPSNFCINTTWKLNFPSFGGQFIKLDKLFIKGHC